MKKEIEKMYKNLPENKKEEFSNLLGDMSLLMKKLMNNEISHEDYLDAVRNLTESDEENE